VSLNQVKLSQTKETKKENMAKKLMKKKKT